MPKDKYGRESNVQIKAVFGLAPGDGTPDGVPIATIMIPEKAWNQMKDGLTSTFDLTAVGIPVKIIVGRCSTYEEGLNDLADGLEARGIKVKRVGSIGIRDIRERGH